MHILVTADTVGGVWTYTRELVTGLAARGVRVTLVSFGGIPSRTQRAWLEGLSGVTYLPTCYPLEWMQDVAEDIAASQRYLRNIVEECKPDLLHLGQFCYGSLDCAAPKLVVAHSDVMSWFKTVKGCWEPSAWSEWYQATVSRGLEGASCVVAPSRWMLEVFEACYGVRPRSRVIYNGRSPALFEASAKENFAVSVGRLWDEGKQSRLLLRLTPPPMPIYLAGATNLLGGAEHYQPMDSGNSGIEFQGHLSEAQMRELMARAEVYIATSKYEPFGLAPLEAALSRCAIVANDIPSFREIWGDAALYFRQDDATALAEALGRLQKDRELHADYAGRAYEHAMRNYTADRMVEEYMNLYSTMLERRVSAA